MSVISWDHVDSSSTALSEKQLESVFILSSLSSNSVRNVGSPENDNTVLNEEETTQPEMTRIHLASHFYTWLSSIEQSVGSESSRSHLEFSEYISQKKEQCSKILHNLDDLLSKLDCLQDDYVNVSQNTNKLHELCEHLLEQQNNLANFASSIEFALMNFASVDMIQSELASLNNFVSRDRLQPILDKLDASIMTFQKHPHYKESGPYIIKAKSALKKTVNLIRDNVTRIIEGTINELAELHDVISPENSFILLYGRFRSQGPKIRTLMSLLEDRVHVAEEYAQVIQECHKFYLQQREELLSPVTKNSVADLMERYSDDHCALLRTSGAFMVHMCEDETRLFNQFFLPKSSNSLNEMLSRLCRCLYDAIRPIIIHINHVEILSQQCDIVKYELLGEYVDGAKEFDMSAFGDFCSMLLADIQERLIFRSFIYIKSQILGYNPSPGDLSYPEKLEMMNTIAQTVSMNESSVSKSKTPSTSELELDTNQTEAADLTIQAGPNMSLAPADLHGMWYPTVRRTVVCLSKLSRCLDADSFRGLAQECVSMCTQSLVKASEAISTRRTAADGQLFLIKHLLILREQMAPFNVEFLVKETSLDFSNYKDAALSIWAKKGSGIFTLNRTNVLLRFLLETPNAIEIEVDSRRQLDGQLKHTCEVFINQQVEFLTGNLADFIKRANNILTAPGARLADQPFANPSCLKDIVSSSHRLICLALGRSSANKRTDSQKSTHVRDLRQYLHIYLANPDTESVLLRRIQAGVITHWRALQRLLVEQYSEEDRMIIACPTESQIRLIFQDTWNPPTTTTQG